jgi:hypothetical protein
MALALLVGVNPRVIKVGPVVRLAAGKWKMLIVGVEKLTLNRHFPEPQESFVIQHGEVLDCKNPTHISLGLGIVKEGITEISAYAEPA